MGLLKMGAQESLEKWGQGFDEKTGGSVEGGQGLCR